MRPRKRTLFGALAVLFIAAGIVLALQDLSRPATGVLMALGIASGTVAMMVDAR